MAYLSPDIILFGLFLALNLFIGLRAGRKVTTVQGFAIGNKDFSTGAVTSTIVATWIGGGFMFYGLQNVYTHGLQFLIVLFGGTLCLLFTGQVLAVRMGEFLNNLSVSEAMGDLYGQTLRVITAISGILGEMGAMAVQFQVIGKMITILLGFKGPSVTIAAASIVILYATFGGIRSVTITDIFQFIAFSIFIPMLALLIWNNLKKPGQVMDTLTQEAIFSLQGVFKWDKQFFSALGLMLYFAIPGLTPPIFQRILMAKDVIQVKDSFTYAAWIRLLIVFSVAFIAILLFTSDPHLEASSLVNHLIAKYARPGLKGLVAVGITAMAMSTADSCLNSCAVLVVNDVIKPLRPAWKITMTKLRLSTGFIGLCALALSLYTTDILKLILLTSSFYMPVVTVPLLLAIFGFRSTPKAVLIGMGAGLITVASWDKVVVNTVVSGLDRIIPGMLANLTFLMGSHYALRQSGGWVGIKDKARLMAARQARQEAWQNLVRTIKETKIYDYLQQNLPAYDAIYSLFGLYVLGATYACFFTIPDNLVSQYQKLYDIAANSVLICTAGFLTYPAWPPTFRAKWFITYAWPVGMGYILFVVGTQLVLMSGFHQVQTMIFLLNLILAAMLLSWPLMLSLAAGGIALGCFVFKQYYGPIHVVGSKDAMQFNFIYIYGILLVSTFLITLFKAKQKRLRIEAQKDSISTAYGDTKKELEQVVTYSQEVLKEIDEYKDLFDASSLSYLRQVVYRMTDYMQLEVTEVNLAALLLDIKKALHLKDFDTPPQLITENHTAISTIYVDEKKIKELFVSTIEIIQQHNVSNKTIRLVVEEATLGHHIGYMKNYTKEVAALRLTLTTADILPPVPEIYLFEPQLSQVLQEKGEEPYSLENTRIIDSHYGYAERVEKATQLYVIPINVREVRGKVMELLRKPVAADADELQHPMAIQLEKELFEKLKNTTVDLRVITKALDTIKRYHAGVRRKLGELFFSHPIAVALILLEYCQDQDAIVAALLHDTVEDTTLSTIHIKALFGETVAFLVGKVTNLEDNLHRLMLGDHENIDRLINYEDKRAVYVKLADRLHNMRTIEGHSKLSKQKHIANETLNFFVLMATTLGLTAVAQELKDLSLEVLAKKG